MSSIDGGVQARELREHAISQELHDPAALCIHMLMGETLEGLDQREREVLIVGRQSGIPRHICKENGSEATFTATGMLRSVRWRIVRQWNVRWRIVWKSSVRWRIVRKSSVSRRIVRRRSVRSFGHQSAFG
jgi:hypothetical protein